MISQNEYIILDLLEEGILVVSTESRTVTYVNKCFLELTLFKKSEVEDKKTIPFLSVEDNLRFWDTVCNLKNTTSEIFSIRDHNQCQDCSTTLTIIFHNINQFGVCCLVEFNKPNHKMLKKLKYYEILDHCSNSSLSIKEYDPIKHDLKEIFTSHGAKLNYKKLGIHLTKTENKYWRRDFGLSETEIDWWIDKCKEAEQRLEQNSYSKKSFYSSETFLKIDVRHVGYSVEEHSLFYVSSRDVTQSLIERQSAAEMYNLLNLFFENSPIYLGCILILEEEVDMKYLLANPACSKLYNETTESIKGKKGTDLGFSSCEISLFVEKLIECRRLQQPITFEFQWGTIWLSYCVQQTGKDTFGYVAHDITLSKADQFNLRKCKDQLEEKVLERTKELERALKVKSRFLATMSHEIRTPLSGIISSLSLLELSILTPEQTELIDIGLICGKQLSSLIEEILDISKIDEVKMKIKKEPLSIRETVNEALQVVLFPALNKNLELICDINHDIPYTILGDKQRLNQILINLLGNAIKFSWKDEVILKLKLVKPIEEGLCEIIFSVKDFGIGIQAEEQENLFQPFTQADSSMNRKYGGTGLGLYISKRLSEMMGGTVWFSSKFGFGSTFYFTIKANLPYEQEISPSYKCFILKEVLVVIKSRRLQKIIGKELKKWEYSYVIRSTTNEATLELKNKHFDVVITDSKQDPVELKEINNNCPVVVANWVPLSQFECYQFLKRPVCNTLGPFLQIFFGFLKPNTEKDLSSLSDERKENLINETLILVAEDNEMNQRIIRRILESIGYKKLIIVDNGIKAVEMVKNNNVNIILMDVMMPEMNGIEATYTIRKMSEIHQPEVIIALTADVSIETREKCFKSGMQDFVTKPVHHKELKLMLERYFPPHNFRR